MALTYTPSLDLGQACPDFNLPGVDGRSFAKSSLPTGRPFLVAFICNHCPYVKAIEDRLVQLGRDLPSRGIAMVAINSNDAGRYPEDSFPAMQAKAREKNYPFPYLHDESQAVARRFDAVCTPDFFLYDRAGRLAYRGRLDDSWKDETKVTKRELFEAALALLDGQSAPANQAPSMGCSMKWKEA